MNAASSIPRESAYVVPGELSTEAITRNLLTLLPTRRRSIAKHRFYRTGHVRWTRTSSRRVAHAGWRGQRTNREMADPRGKRSFRDSNDPSSVLLLGLARRSAEGRGRIHRRSAAAAGAGGSGGAGDASRDARRSRKGSGPS